MSNTINIPYKPKGRKPKGEDGFKITTIRVKNETIGSVDHLAAQSNRSRNEIITLLIEEGIKKAKVTDK